MDKDQPIELRPAMCKEVSIPRQSRGVWEVSRSKRLLELAVQSR
jgi:hypothetical protein